MRVSLFFTLLCSLALLAMAKRHSAQTAVAEKNAMSSGGHLRGLTNRARPIISDAQLDVQR